MFINTYFLIIYDDTLIDINKKPRIYTNSFKNYFVNVGENIAKHVQSNIILKGETNSFINNSNNDNYIYNNTLQYKNFSESEVMAAINKLRKGASPGFAGISSNVFMHDSEYITKPIKHLVNSSFYKSIHPFHCIIRKILKISLIIDLFY